MWLLCRRKIDAHACTRQFCTLTCRGRGMSWVVACDCFVGVRFDVHDARGSFDIAPKRCTCRSHTCHMRTFICIIMHKVDFRCGIVIDAHSYASACARSFVMELNTLSRGLLMDSILHHLVSSYLVRQLKAAHGHMTTGE